MRLSYYVNKKFVNHFSNTINMKYWIILILMVGLMLPTTAQKDFEQVDWQEELQIKSRHDFIGNHGSRMFFIMDNDTPEYGERIYHKGKEVQKLVAYDYKRKTYDYYQVTIDFKHWYSAYVLKGEWVHVFVNTFNPKTKKVSYWHSSYRTVDMGMATDWTLVGTFDNDEKLKDWKKNEVVSIQQTNNAQDQSDLLLLYNYYSNNYGAFIQFSENGTLKNSKVLEYKPMEKGFIGGAHFLQMIVDDKDQLYVLNRFSENKKKAYKTKLNNSWLGLSIHDLKSDKQEVALIKDSKYANFAGTIELKEGRLLVSSIQMEKEFTEETMSALTLYELRDGAFSKLDQIEHNEPTFFRDHIKMPRVMRGYKAHYKKMNTDHTLFVLAQGCEKIETRMQGADSYNNWKQAKETLSQSNYTERKYYRMLCFYIDTNQNKIKWLKGIDYGANISTLNSMLLHHKDDQVKVVNRNDVHYLDSQKGKINTHKSLEIKTKKMKKNILFDPSLGYIDLEDEFIVLGKKKKTGSTVHQSAGDRGSSQLFIGVYKK